MSDLLDKIRKIVLEGSSDSFMAMHTSKITDVPYDTGKVFKASDVINQAHRPKDNSENGEDFLQDLVDNIKPDDEDIMELVRKWDQESDLDDDDLDRDAWHSSNKDRD